MKNWNRLELDAAAGADLDAAAGTDASWTQLLELTRTQLLEPTRVGRSHMGPGQKSYNYIETIHVRLDLTHTAEPDSYGCVRHESGPAASSDSSFSQISQNENGPNVLYSCF